MKAAATPAAALLQAASASAAQPSYRYASIDGIRIFFREAGPADAPAVVLLHGYPSSSRMYRGLIPKLAEKYHVIAPDYPGFGHSDAPSPERFHYTFDHLAEMTDGLLGALGVTRYVLFMQDYGGPVGFRLALAHPEKVRAMIVQNANAYDEGLGAKWKEIAAYWANPRGHPDQLAAFMSLDGAKRRHIGDSPHPERYDPDTWTDEFAFLSGPGQREIQAALLYDYRTNVAAYPKWQAWLREHKPPMLVMWGRYDPSFIAPGAEAYRRDLPNAEIHVLDAGHFALDEQPELIARYTLDFLDRHLH